MQTIPHACDAAQVGESGLGKTTFIQNLQATFQPDAPPTTPTHGEPADPYELFEQSPQDMCTEVTINNATSKFHYLLQVHWAYCAMQHVIMQCNVMQSCNAVQCNAILLSCKMKNHAMRCYHAMQHAIHCTLVALTCHALALPCLIVHALTDTCLMHTLQLSGQTGT